MFENIPKALAAIGNAAVDGFKKIDWVSLGSNVISGIVNGIKNGASLVVDAAKNLAKEAFNAAKDFLGISSPSKLFKWIGNMVDEGYSEGIDEESDLVSESIKKLIDINPDDFGFNPEDNIGYREADSSLTKSGTYNDSTIINVYGAVGQDVRELADIISGIINDDTKKKQMAWGSI